ncbi:predicted protein [Naegleria gruberi]|uniref:Predicted protein n=1 Tax=Naegleria gruberi TaxID=5762 RepID=D2V0V6_NAEGR|nr:uncharacterized protein NAEGRDRAFT_78076 [Naegleria gruberi]EFC49796.1 predicted protein [Naegleria gruberi]|eukprot:XP_002682540.1 predicted protein [Naegleria gruberi strain NEG-M]
MKVSESALQKFETLLSNFAPQSVNLSVQIDAGHLPTDQIGVQCEIPFLVRLLSGNLPPQEEEAETTNVLKTPVNICLVLDISGSMDEPLKNRSKGSKLTACKSAIRELVTNFLTYKDTIHLITYSDSPKTVFTEKNKESVNLNDIDKISTEGSTNIASALHSAVDLLHNSNAPGTKLIAFFSDGQCNVGETNLNIFGSGLLKKLKDYSEGKDDQIHISSYGVGSDYDELWLQAIARTGKGEYYYLEDETYAKDAFERSLKKYKYQIGKKFNVTVSGLNGVTVKSFNRKSDLNSLISGVSLGGLFCRDLRFIEGVLVYNPQNSATLEALKQLDSNNGLPMLKVDYSYISNTDEQIVKSVNYIHTRFASNTSELSTQLKLYETSAERNDFTVQNSILSIADLQVQFNQLLEQHNSEKALELAKQIEEKYKELVEKDQYGIVEQLYTQAVHQRSELEKHGISESYKKVVSKSASVALKVSKKEAKAQYECEYDDCEDEEAYGGLF